MTKAQEYIEASEEALNKALVSVTIEDANVAVSLAQIYAILALAQAQIEATQLEKYKNSKEESANYQGKR